jgi:phosphatidylglycerophosphatase C
MTAAPIRKRKKRKTYAFFDFDGTIVRRDTFLDILMFERGIAVRIKLFAAMIPATIFLIFRIYPLEKIKTGLVRKFFGGMSQKEFVALCRRYAEERIPQYLDDRALARIAWHKKKGHTVAIVSASVETWIRAWAERAGIEHVIATVPEFINGKMTGAFVSRDCSGKEKVRRIIAYFPDAEQCIKYAYGDSIGDRRMLAFADYPFYRKFE